MMKKMLAIFLNLMLTILPKISNEIRAELLEMLKKLEEKAKKTKNPIDDLIVALLIGIIEE